MADTNDKKYQQQVITDFYSAAEEMAQSAWTPEMRAAIPCTCSTSPPGDLCDACQARDYALQLKRVVARLYKKLVPQ